MYQRPSNQTIGSLFLLLFATALPIGCQFAPKKVPSSWNWGEEETPVVPDRILAIWTDTVLRQPNQPGVRGFGGRVFFYEKDQNDPIEVDGKLVVFVFDAEDQDPENQKPLRKYVIEADDFKKHMSKTSIGPAYSVWLPWGDVKGPTMKLSIIARYEGRKGGTTLSDPTIKLLPGVESKSRKSSSSPSDKHSPAENLGVESVNPPAASGVQSANYLQATNKGRKDAQAVSGVQGLVEPRKLTEPNRPTQTIELPPSFQRHFQRSDLAPSTETVSPIVPEITRSQVTTEVIDARSQKLGTFKRAFAEPNESTNAIHKSSASRLEALRSGRSISKKSSENGMFPNHQPNEMMSSQVGQSP